MAFDFASNTSAISYGSPTYLNNKTTVSYSFWVQQDAYGGQLGLPGYFFSKGVKGFNPGNDSVSMTFFANRTGSQLTRTAPKLTNSATTWRHVAMTWNGGGTAGVNLYVDGVIVSTGGTEGSGGYSDDSGSWLIVGNNTLTAGQYNYNGRICEFAAWSAVLTADEIAALAKGFKPCRIRPQSILIHDQLIRDSKEIIEATVTTVNLATPANDHPRVY